jgi:hypothetical protein
VEAADAEVQDPRRERSTVVVRNGDAEAFDVLECRHREA